VVDQHATWIAVNPIQGCPKSCTYCFLTERGQTAVRPERVASPPETLGLLTTSPFYAPDRPVALYTWTDVMALPSSREHLTELLALLVHHRIPNPIVLITKCAVPDELLGELVAARLAGLRIIVYLSYSGLSRDIERGIRQDESRTNFPRLADAGIPIVHYWRPSFPESATAGTMRSVLSWAATYARCTVAAGLKVEPAALPRLARLWPELAVTSGVTSAEGVYPRPFWDFIHTTRRHHPEYPLFHTNSCALAYVIGQPDRFGIFGSPLCRIRNHCPHGQRSRCADTTAARPAVTDTAVHAALNKRGYPRATFELDRAQAEVVIHDPLPTNTVAALTHDLGIRVRAARHEGDPYWSSGTAGALPLVIGEAG
jgi:DNA repair photolyase